MCCITQRMASNWNACVTDNSVMVHASAPRLADALTVVHTAYTAALKGRAALNAEGAHAPDAGPPEGVGQPLRRAGSTRSTSGGPCSHGSPTDKGNTDA